MSKLLKKYTKSKKGRVSEMKIRIMREDRKFKIDPTGEAKMVKEAHDTIKTKSNYFTMFVRLWGPTRQYTFLVDDTGELINYLNDYFSGTVQDTSKLTRSGMVQIYIQKYD